MTAECSEGKFITLEGGEVPVSQPVANLLSSFSLRTKSLLLKPESRVVRR